MPNRIVRVILVVTLAAAGLALSRGGPARSHDLDTYSDADLAEDLNAELDDLFAPDGPLDPDKAYPVAELQELVMEALEDEGDDEDEEADVDFQDIVDEMSEAGTTTETCIHDAILSADDLSLRDTPDASEGLFRNVSLAMAQGRKRNGFATSRVAVDRSVRAIIVDVRRTRR